MGLAKAEARRAEARREGRREEASVKEEGLEVGGRGQIGGDTDQ